jgi:hypothetical protein
MMGTTTQPAGRLDGAAGAFGVATAVTIVFNTALAWIKDAYDPLNSFMARLTSHHWITHGLFDLIVFLAVGIVLMRRGASFGGNRLLLAVIAATLAGGGGLTLWFVLF